MNPNEKQFAILNNELVIIHGKEVIKLSEMSKEEKQNIVEILNSVKRETEQTVKFQDLRIGQRFYDPRSNAELTKVSRYHGKFADGQGAHFYPEETVKPID